MKTLNLILFLILLFSIFFHPVSVEAQQGCEKSCAKEDLACQSEPHCRDINPDDLPDVVLPTGPKASPNQVTIPLSQPTNTDGDGDPVPVVQPVPARPVAPSIPLRPVAPPKPVITCQANGIRFFVGQKRYDCAEPRQRASCEADAGAGIPFVCNGRGEWDERNNGKPECATECVVSNQANSCPIEGDTCFYSQKRDDGLGDVCFSGRGATGFNQGKCTYSCGPVSCDNLVALNSQSQPAVPVQSTPTSTDDEVCNGSLTSACLSDSATPRLITDWSITPPAEGDQSCNVYIRDGSGDHTLSQNCSGSWSGESLPDGEAIVNGGSYEFYVSNGNGKCLNKKAGSTEASCQPARSEDDRVGLQPIQPGDQGLFDGMIDVVTDIFE